MLKIIKIWIVKIQINIEKCWTQNWLKNTGLKEIDGKISNNL